jgi:glycosyltransferase involved in cell wall biosynthesis
MDKINVIIPTYNRFKYLLNTIKSVKEQTYKNIEIMVVNDCSTEKEYYEYNWKDNDITIIHLDENSKKKFGFACAGFVRNKGIEMSNGKYIAFCDDDDIWFPTKLELQIKTMKENNCKMSSTDGLIGKGIYNNNIKYKKYNGEHYYQKLQSIYKKKGSQLLNNGFPNIWDLNFLKIHNCMICSSVVIEKEILDKINNMKCVKNGVEDYDCWKRALHHTNSVYVQEICFYYDTGHGYGSNYK